MIISIRKEKTMTETILNFENFKLPFLSEGSATKTFTQNSTHTRVVNL